MGIACISISQRLALTEFHAQVRNKSQTRLSFCRLRCGKATIHEDMLGATSRKLTQEWNGWRFHAQELHLGAPNEKGWTLANISPVEAPSDPEDNDNDMAGGSDASPGSPSMLSPASSTVDLGGAADETGSVTDEDSESGGVLVGG